MSVSLYFPTQSGATETVSVRNPERDNAEDDILVQGIGRTRGGGRVVYDKGVGYRILRLSFTELDDTTKQALDDFFRSTACGQAESFQYEDHHGNLWDAHFNQSTLAWVNIGEKTLPDTDPVWSVEIELEATPAN